MIRALRHLSIRLWITALAGIPVSFIFLTHFGKFISKENFSATAIILFTFFFAVGYLMNQAGRRSILKFVKEAETWERLGIHKKSEEKYLKALRIYDSFLISSWKNRKTTEKLTGSIAKFSLTCSVRNPAFDSAVTAFLSMVPDDADIALLWLEKLCRTGTPSLKDQEILTRLAEIHINSPEMVILMADIFIRLHRIDFAARKIYKKALISKDLKQSTGAAIKECLATEEKTLSAYAISDQVLPHDLNKDASVKIFKSRAKYIRNFISRFLKISMDMIIFIFKYAVSALIRLTSFVKQRDNVLTYVKWGISAIVCAGLIFLVINTFSRLFPGKIPVASDNKQKIEVHIPELYTIQVAAYLKKKYGDAYVAELKSKGLDAYLSQVEGGGKTWFLVRVSGFPDRKKAALYGKKLKKQGYIDDFFVDNNSRQH